MLCSDPDALHQRKGQTMHKYYVFNKTASHPIRVPVTLSEYRKAKREPDRWFLDFGNCVLEVTKTQYEKYYKEDQHSRYLQRVAAHTDPVQSLSKLEEVITYEMSIFGSAEPVSVEEQVIERLMMTEATKHLKEAMKLLAADELCMVIKLHIRQEKQSDLADALGISQQTVSRRNQKILQKLREMLEMDEI